MPGAYKIPKGPIASEPANNGQEPSTFVSKIQSGETKGDAELPRLILPSDEVSFERCANACFPRLAKTRKFFVRGRTVVELVRSDSRNVLEEVESAAFRSRLEKYFSLVRWRKLPDGKVALKASRCSTDSALALLKTEAALQHLPNIRIGYQLANLHRISRKT